MNRLTLQIDDAILERHPDIVVGSFLVEDLHVATAACSDNNKLFQDTASALGTAKIDLDNLTSEPRVAA